MEGRARTSGVCSSTGAQKLRSSGATRVCGCDSAVQQSAASLPASAALTSMCTRSERTCCATPATLNPRSQNSKPSAGFWHTCYAAPATLHRTTLDT